MSAPRPSLARRLLRFAAVFVPAADRRRWLAEWEAELWVIEHTPPDGGPTAMSLGFGALAHSLWKRKECSLGMIMQDARYAFRVLARSPALSALAVITMALGIGANTTIFSMTNATLLRAPDAIEEPDRIVQIGRDRPDQGFDSMSYAWFRELRGVVGGAEAMAAYTSESLVIGAGEDVAVTSGSLVTGEYFRVLGVDAAIGRVLGDDDDRPAAAQPVAVLSHGLWTRRYAADPEAIGRTLRINGSSYEIIGVAERGFRGTEVISAASDVWIPLGTAGRALGPAYDDFDRHDFSWLRMLAKLRDEASAESLAGEINAYYQPRFEEVWGESAGYRIGVVAGVGLRPGDRDAVARLMTLLTLVVIVVLAVACANLANLLLARGIARSRELSVRTALGAGRARLVRQLLTESVLLAAGGGLLALLLTYWTADLIPRVLPMSVGVSFRPDLKVFGFAAAVSLAAGTIFGIAPALRASRAYAGEALKEASALHGRRGGWLRNGLVVGQLALSFALLAITGLLVQSLLSASAAEPGYNTRDVMTVSLNLDLAGYDETRGEQFFRRLVDGAAALSGVEAAATGSNLPFAGWRRQSVYWPDPRPDLEREFVEIDTSTVDLRFVGALEIPILAGEGFTAANAGPEMPAVALLSESAARLFWPHDSAIGKLLPRDESRTPDESFRIVGVVADVQVRSLREPPRPSLYLASTQQYRGGRTLFVRAAGDPNTLAQPLRSLVAELDGNMGVLQMGSLHARMGRSLSDTLTVARLGGIFGVLAAVLAAVGLYGAISYLASSRTHEVGVRIALGAGRYRVIAMFVRQAVAFAAAGVGAGLLLTLAAGSAIRGFLYGVSTRDPATLIAIAIGITAIAVVAAVAPALRATRISPVTALRN